ncbi:hypothetical protein [Undibacterium sp. Di24W]|uniref:hypothetical protein n=1 Tax=Undibacterium sp. Di24W TaxID=3413033 RepID=UPI003BEF7D97
MLEFLSLMVTALLLPALVFFAIPAAIASFRRRAWGDLRTLVLHAAMWGGIYLLWNKFAPYGAFGDVGVGRSAIVYPITIMFELWTLRILVKMMGASSKPDAANRAGKGGGVDAT